MGNAPFEADGFDAQVAEHVTNRMRPGFQRSIALDVGGARTRTPPRSLCGGQSLSAENFLVCCEPCFLWEFSCFLRELHLFTLSNIIQSV